MTLLVSGVSNFSHHQRSCSSILVFIYNLINQIESELVCNLLMVKNLFNSSSLQFTILYYFTITPQFKSTHFLSENCSIMSTWFCFDYSFFDLFFLNLLPKFNYYHHQFAFWWFMFKRYFTNVHFSFTIY
jgi:hypothetical protein